MSNYFSLGVDNLLGSCSGESWTRDLSFGPKNCCVGWQCGGLGQVQPKLGPVCVLPPRAIKDIVLKCEGFILFFSLLLSFLWKTLYSPQDPTQSTNDPMCPIHPSCCHLQCFWLKLGLPELSDPSLLLSLFFPLSVNSRQNPILIV